LPDADAAEAEWFPVGNLSAPAFDRGRILVYALERLGNKLQYTVVGFQLVQEKFTLSELRAVYETILGKRLDKCNFRRKIRKLGTLKPLRERQHTGRKPAPLFRFATRRIARL